MPLQSTRQTRHETVKVLRYLYNQPAGSRYLSRAEISKATGVHVDSVSAILTELSNHEAVRLDPVSRRFEWIDRGRK